MRWKLLNSIMVICLANSSGAISVTCIERPELRGTMGGGGDRRPPEVIRRLGSSFRRYIISFDLRFLEETYPSSDDIKQSLSQHL
jgi:hypothetical protein